MSTPIRVLIAEEEFLDILSKPEIIIDVPNIMQLSLNQASQKHLFNKRLNQLYLK